MKLLLTSYLGGMVRAQGQGMRCDAMRNITTAAVEMQGPTEQRGVRQCFFHCRPLLYFVPPKKTHVRRGLRNAT